MKVLIPLILALFTGNAFGQLYLDGKPIPESVNHITVDLYTEGGPSRITFRMYVETEELAGSITDAAGAYIKPVSISGVLDHLAANGWEYAGEYYFRTISGKGAFAQNNTPLTGTLFKRKR